MVVAERLYIGRRCANLWNKCLPVPRSRALWLFLLFVLQSLGCMVIVTYQEIVGNTTDTALETAIAVGKGFEPFVIIITATSIIAVEGAAMLYDWYKREVEERAERRTTRRNKEETLRLAREWDRLSPEEKRNQSSEDFFRRNLEGSDKKE